MAGKKLTADNLQKAVTKILNSYRDITWNNVDEAAQRIAKKARTAVANESKQFDTRWGLGQYSRGWRVTERKELWWSVYVIHNSKKPTETHLLEEGHALIPGTIYYERDKNGKILLDENDRPIKHVNFATRAKAYPHIGPVAKNVPEDMTKEVLNAIPRSN